MEQPRCTTSYNRKMRRSGCLHPIKSKLTCKSDIVAGLRQVQYLKTKLRIVWTAQIGIQIVLLLCPSFVRENHFAGISMYLYVEHQTMRQLVHLWSRMRDRTPPLVPRMLICL